MFWGKQGTPPLWKRFEEIWDALLSIYDWLSKLSKSTSARDWIVTERAYDTSLTIKKAELPWSTINPLPCDVQSCNGGPLHKFDLHAVTESDLLAKRGHPKMNVSPLTTWTTQWEKSKSGKIQFFF